MSFYDRLTGNHWFLLLAGAFCLFYVWRGFVTGSTLLVYRTVTRSEDGYLYWWAIAMKAAAGAACVLGSVGIIK